MSRDASQTFQQTKNSPKHANFCSGGRDGHFEDLAQLEIENWLRISEFSTIQLYTCSFSTRYRPELKKKRLKITNLKQFLIINVYHFQKY